MTEVFAYYYDGKSSVKAEVKVSTDDLGMVHVSGEAVDYRCAFSELDIPPRIANMRGVICFPDGASCETEDIIILDQWIKQAGKGQLNRWIHRWENSLKYAVIAIVLTGSSGWGFIIYGVPILAKSIAYTIPESSETLMGKQTLEILDKNLFEPSRLGLIERQILKDNFRSLVQMDPNAPDYEIVFRYSDKTGANAFALPSGSIVITDGLVDLAKNDNEIFAVLAHEIGHLENRHILRHVIQSSFIALAIVMVTGDVVSSGSLVVLMPTALIQANFSRQFESEADHFASGFLAARNVSPEHLGTILTRLSEQDKGFGLPSILSTHPALEERIMSISKSE